MEAGDFVGAQKLLAVGFAIQNTEYKLDVEDPGLYLAQGDLYLKQGKKEMARDAWQKAAAFRIQQLEPVKQAQQRLTDNP